MNRPRSIAAAILAALLIAPALTGCGKPLPSTCDTISLTVTAGGKGGKSGKSSTSKTKPKTKTKTKSGGHSDDCD